MRLIEVSPPSHLGPYVIGRKLGSGGMATVYAARQDGAHVRRLVALKILSSAAGGDDPDHVSFMREAQLAMRLEHPNIVRTYDVGEIEGRFYLAMELVHGAPLLAVQAASAAPVGLEIAIRIASELARALHAAHELQDPEQGYLGVVHQDVTPHNVILGYDGSVKLVDFGVARFGLLEGSSTASLRGKPSYASPEQINGVHIDRRTDVFALGVLFWELLTGARLFHRKTPAATYLAVLQDRIPDVREFNADVPEAIAKVVAGALERARDARIETADAFRRALAKARDAIAEATDEDLSRWVTALVPPGPTPAELEREIGTSQRTSHEAFDSPRMGLRAASLYDTVPELELPLPPASQPRIAARPAAVEAPGATSASIRAAPATTAGLHPPADDDFGDMEIERAFHGGAGAAAMPPSSRGSGSHPIAPTSSRSGARQLSQPEDSGLDVAHRRLARSRPEYGGPSRGTAVLGWLVTLVLVAGTAGPLATFVHHRAGVPIARLWPHAFDGTSAVDSGVLSIVLLLGAFASGGLGLKLVPRSWAFVAAGGAILVAALAMVTVTLGSTGESPAPPDGALLVPYLAPLAGLALAFGLMSRAQHAFTSATLATKLVVIPFALAAGALLFGAVETSPLAHVLLP